MVPCKAPRSLGAGDGVGKAERQQGGEIGGEMSWVKNAWQRAEGWWCGGNRGFSVLLRLLEFASGYGEHLLS